MEHKILSFIKFGEEEFMRDLYENGTIYMNTVEHFRKIEEDELRGDSYEGATRVINSLPGSFTIPGIRGKFKFQKAHVKETLNYDTRKIYSLFTISSYWNANPSDFKIDERIKGFGEYAVMITENDYFMKTMISALNDLNLKYDHGFVKFFDKNIDSKELNLFHKQSYFKYQKEFRFIADNGKPGPLSFQIGSLKPFARLLKTEDILKLKLERKSTL